MPLHILIQSDAGRAFRFNVDSDWIGERIVEPWNRGDDFVVDGKHWSPRQVQVSILETEQEVATEGDGLGTWIRLTSDRVGQLVTDDYIAAPAGAASQAKRTHAEDRRKVMVIHGRNAAANQAMFTFLRAIDLRPMEWTTLVGEVNVGTPYIGQVLDEAFSVAQAAVVLATPDDLVRLRPELVPSGDPDSEATVEAQARPNVFLEAGMALATFPTQTVITELGPMRAASDLGGRHTVRLDDQPECRRDLASRLENAGCLVDISGTDWLTAGDFRQLAMPSEDSELVTDPLAARLVALLDSVSKDKGGYVEWGVAEHYNNILDEAGFDEIPRAIRSARSDYSEMGYRELIIHLKQAQALLSTR